MMAFLFANNSRACALICIGLSRSNAGCRALGIVQRQAFTSRLPSAFSHYVTSSWLAPTFISRKSVRCQRKAYFVHRATFSCIESTASKWKFISNDQQEYNATNNNCIKNILVCGDGDLSYCAEIAPELQKMGVELYATVLEEEDIHNKGTIFLSLPAVWILTTSAQILFFFSSLESLSIFQVQHRDNFCVGSSSHVWC